MKSIVLGFFVMITCTCYYLLKSDKISFKKLIWIIYFVILSLALYKLFALVIDHIQNPKIWDFTAYYLYGKVAVEGYNFYLPESYQIVFNSAHLPFTNFEGLVEEVVNVGCPYPPPTILYVMPLGFLSYYNALIYWTFFNIIFAFGSIYLIYSMFFKKDKLNGLFLVVTLFCIFSPVRSTISFSQTNFILLFLLLLIRKYYNSKIAGVFLAIAIFTKPYMLIFGLFFFLTGRWKTIVCFLISSVLIVGSTVLIIGKQIFMSYFLNNPTVRIPKAVFSEPINQSLHAVLLRANLITMEKPYLYLIIALLVLSICFVYVLYLLKQKQYDFLWVVFLLVALLIYPATLDHYGVLLLFVIFQFFQHKQPLGLNMYLNIPVIGVFYYFSSISFFLANCFLLIIIVIISFSQNLPLTLKIFLSNSETYINRQLIFFKNSASD
jgi:hypothetical protein